MNYYFTFSIKSFARTCFYFSFFIFLTSCPTMGEFEQLKSRVDVLEKEKKTLAEQQKQERERMEELHKKIVEATEILNKSGANMGADIEELKIEQKRFKGTWEELTFAIGKLREEIEIIKKYLDEKLGFTFIPILKDLPDDKDGLLKIGTEKFKAGDMLTARVVMKKFLDIYPNDEKAPHAQFIVGETYFKENKYNNAVKEFQKVHDKYKDVKDAPVEKSLLRIVDCFIQTKDCKKAIELLKYLIEFNKKSPDAQKYKDLLKKLKKDCK